MCKLSDREPQQVFILETTEIRKKFLSLLPDWILEDFEDFLQRTLDTMLANCIAESMTELVHGLLPVQIEYKGKEYYAEYAANFHLDDRADEYPDSVYEVFLSALTEATDINSELLRSVIDGQRDQLMSVRSPQLQPLWHGVPRNNLSMFLEFHGDIRAYYWDMYGKFPE